MYGPLDLLAHFQVQALVLAIAGFGASVLLKSRTGAVLLGATAIGTVAQVAPLLLPPPAPPLDATASLRVTAINVRTDNPDHQSAAQWILGEDADAVLCQELDTAWAKDLDAALHGYTRVPTDTLRADNFGIALYLRDGVKAVRLDVHLEPAGLPWFDGVLRKDGRDIQFVGMHPPPPGYGDSQTRRDQQLALGEQLLERDPLPGVLCGDLNATLWSLPLREMRERGALRPAAHGRGLKGSWPTGLWFTGMILIDHVWVEGGVWVQDFRVGDHFGSDHRGVTADLVY